MDGVNPGQMTGLTSNFGTWTRQQFNGAGVSPNFWNNTGSAYTAVSATGSRTITPTWTTALFGAPVMIISFWKDVDGTTPVLDQDAESEDDEVTLPSVTVTSTTDCAVIALDAAPLGAPPSNPTGWTSRLTHEPAGDVHDGRLRTANSPGASTTTATCVTAFYSSISALVLQGVSGGGGSSGDTGLSTETDAALALTANTTEAVGLAAETDTALALTGTQSLPVGLSTETDEALALAGSQAVAIGLAAETDTALALSSSVASALGLAIETDTAFALTGVQSLPVGLAIETDDALALAGSQALPVGLATEVDTAFELTSLTPGGVGVAEETDTAFALTGSQSLPVGLATSAETALALLGSQLLAITPADETDTAFSLSASVALSVGLATSFEQAFALTAFAPEEAHYAYALRGKDVDLCRIRYWNGAQWVGMEYKYWNGSEFVAAPEN